MKSNFKDILTRIPSPPLWWDQNGVPRYDPFSPDLCPDIYANAVVLLLIECQKCQREFQVQMAMGYFHSIRQINPKKWHYGDPPIHDCVGDTMNCEDLEVLQVWAKDSGFKWVRREDLEGIIK